MEQKPNRILSGCIVWLIVFFLISSCLIPVGIFISSFSIITADESIIMTLGSFMCPGGSDPIIDSYQSTIMDEDGLPRTNTVFEMKCLDAKGEMVKNLGGSYGVIWVGIFIIGSILISGLLALVLAIPLTKFFRPKFKRNSNLPPLVKIQ